MRSIFGPSLLFSAAALVVAAPAFAQHHAEDEAAPSEDAPWSQADAYFDPDEMAASRAHVQHHHGSENTLMVMADRFEMQDSDNATLGVFDVSASYGGDINRLYVQLEGEYDFDASEAEHVSVDVLWSRAISTYFDLQAGISYDIEPDGLAHAALGFQGLAPYWFEVDGRAYLSEKGDLTAKFEAEYDFLLTQRLILQPRAELKFAAQDDPEHKTGSGLTNFETGLRLRYDIIREFSPYIGITYHAAMGETDDMLEVAGEDTDSAAFLVGFRAWY